MPDIFEEIVRIRRERSNASLATVVGGERGAPGKTGFRMLVYPDGWSGILKIQKENRLRR